MSAAAEIRVTLVGLGLIGGSLAKALTGYPAVVQGVERDPITLKAALDDGVVARGWADFADCLPHTDLLVLCLSPGGIIACIERLRAYPRPLWVTDVGGVKADICAAASNLPAHIAFIGGHPMAGREKGGYAQSSATLFRGAHWLLMDADVPKAFSDTLHGILRHIGIADMPTTTAAAHDAHIAYTSQLMHLLALAICDDPLFAGSRGYEGGSFAGATRVAALDAELWFELMTRNRENLAASMASLEEHLAAWRQRLQGDPEAFRRALKEASDAKKAWDARQRGALG